MEVSTPTLTILFYGGSSLLERAIERVTHSRFCHVALELGGVVYEEQAPGLIVETGKLAAARAAGALAHRALPITSAEAGAVTRFVTAEIGTHYNVAALATDLIAILSHGHVRLVLAQSGDYDCSGIVATVLQQLGYALPDDPRLMSPQDVATVLSPLSPGGA